MRPESTRVGMYTFNSRLGTRITAYKSGSRLSNCAARSNRDIIDSNGLSSLISLMSSTIAVDINSFHQLEDAKTAERWISSVSEILTQALSRRHHRLAD